MAITPGVCPPPPGHKQLMRRLAMQVPCRIFYSAWHLLWRANCSDIYWAFGAPGEIRTPDPQIRSLSLDVHRSRANAVTVAKTANRRGGAGMAESPP
jgi:hypothetical protein